jgi:hypothetical protein
VGPYVERTSLQIYLDFFLSTTMPHRTSAEAEPQYTRAQARVAGHVEERSTVSRSSVHTRQSLAGSSQPRQSLAEPVVIHSRSPHSSRPSQKFEGVLNFGSDAVIYHRKQQQNSFSSNHEISGQDRQRDHQSRGRSVPPGARLTPEISETADHSPKFLEDELRHDMSQRGLRREAYLRLLNPPHARPPAAPPSERELFAREKYLFLKERAIFLRERQIFTVEKEQFLLEKKELLRQADVQRRAPAESLGQVRAPAQQARRD